jgi:hypothetical protein
MSDTNTVQPSELQQAGASTLVDRTALERSVQESGLGLLLCLGYPDPLGDRAIQVRRTYGVENTSVTATRTKGDTR